MFNVVLMLTIVYLHDLSIVLVTCTCKLCMIHFSQLLKEIDAEREVLKSKVVSGSLHIVHLPYNLMLSACKYDPSHSSSIDKHH